MSDLQNLRESILQKAHQEGQAQFDKAKEELEQEFQTKLKAQLHEKESMRNVQLNREKQRLSRLEHQVLNQERQASLNSRQALMDQLFAGAVQKMEAWDNQTFLEFTTSILNKFKDKELQVVFGEKTRNQLSSPELQSLLKQFPKLTIAEESISDQSGFVVKDQRVDYNFMFDQLVDSVRNDLSADLAQQVFNTK
uniref:hypothetical protein n=1 Tax=Globicatella sulfidifaciens TaxID=136093 RepID=UPI0023F13F5A|nr:hypothetical protein [Globicatella sulfidifaciens]